jgi:peptide/nickel transport system permease protein
VFSLSHIAPGDPAIALLGPKADPELVERITKDLGLDKPLHIQYLNWLKNVLFKGSLGTSFRTEEPVTKVIFARLPVSIELSIMSFIFAMIIALISGVISAVKQNTFTDYIVRVCALIGISIPEFVSGISLILVFGIFLTNLLPVGGWVPLSDGIIGNLKHLILPSFSLGIVFTAFVARMIRSDMIGVLGEEYILVARAFGISERTIILNDAFKNAFIPTLTVIGFSLGVIMTGAVLTETVFALPGIGRLIVDSIYGRDLPVLQGLLLLISVVFILLNLTVDFLYGLLDPRIRYERI